MVELGNNEHNQKLKRRGSKSKREAYKPFDKCKQSSNASTIQRHRAINVDVAAKIIFSARITAAIWSHIGDCDETFNYWEPLHYLIYGHGLQTWEYSPEYALRSYAYLFANGLPGWLLHLVLPSSPLIIFYCLRFFFVLVCTAMEIYFYKAVCREFGHHVGRLWLIFQVFSPGMFIASTSLLPSTFAMYFNGAALAAWWHQKYRLSIFLVCLSAFLGWPFAALIGLPICYDIIVNQKLYKTFFLWSIISSLIIGGPMVIIDSMYYGRFVFAPLNLVLYNVFTSHGANIFGTEPFTYYIVNGFLNFNIVWLCALLLPLMVNISYYVIPTKSRPTLYLPYRVSLAPFYLWLAVFMIQSHKEERFLFPIYPLITLCGAITVDFFQKLYFFVKNWLKPYHSSTHYLDHSMFIAVTSIIISIIFSLSRILALYSNYNAPMHLFTELNTNTDTNINSNQIYNICVGKDWYRYPNSFFLPLNFRLRFLKSEFNGMLPAYFSEHENSTMISHLYFNDRNEENSFMYFDYAKCNFLFDLETANPTKLEPNYSTNTKEWSIIKSLPFINVNQSHRLFRSFYIPFWNNKFIEFSNFNLLLRKSNV